MKGFFQVLAGVSGGFVYNPSEPTDPNPNPNPNPNPEGIQSYMFNNKSWSWWTNPLMYYDEPSNSSYASVVNDDGDQELICVNHTTGETTSIAVFDGLRDIKDEHNTAGILVQDDHILWAVGRRLQNGYWIGKVSKDLKTVIKPATEIGTASQLVIPCYASFYKVGSRIFIFTRSAREDWHFIYSDDAGETWSVRRRLISKTEGNPTGWLYIMGQVDGDIIKFVAYANAHMAEEGLNRIVPFTFNTVTGEVVCDGVSYGDAYNYSEYTPLNFNNAPSLISVVDKTRFSDICGVGNITNIVIIDFESTDFSQGMYRYIKFDQYTNQVLEDINIVAHGADNGYPSYFGGIFFEKDDDGSWSGNVWLSRENNGTWYCEMYSYENGAFVLSETIDTVVRNPGDICIMRPQPPVNSSKGGIRAWYAKGDWLNDGYEDWDTDIIAVGDNPVDYYANVYYRATFNQEVGGNISPDQLGLKAYHGDTAIDISNDSAKAPIASNPAGDKVNPVNTTYDEESGKLGYAAYAGGTSKFLLIDDNITIPSSINKLSWFQGNANTTAENFFAIKVGTQWFIHSESKKNSTAISSGSGFSSGGDKIEIEVIGNAEWYPLNFTPGSELFYTNTLQELPEGSITGVGMYVEDNVGGDTFRFDDLEIK